MDSIPVGPGKYLSYSSKLYAIGGYGMAWNLGFNCDIKRKQKQLFSLSVYYKQGVSWGEVGSLTWNILNALKIHPATTWTYDDTEVTVDNKRYTHEIYSRGSGIYVQLSKDISFQRKNTARKGEGQHAL
jgi:hypothetical protein